MHQRIAKYIFRSIPVVLIGMLFSCENDVEKVRELTAFDDAPLESAYDLELMITDSGRARVKMITPQMDYYLKETPIRECPKGLLVIFYDSLQQEESRLTANYGIFYEDQDLVEVEDSVVFINKRGEILNTEQLIWNRDSGKVYTDKFVKITRNDAVIHGHNGMEANETFTKWRIKKVKDSNIHYDEAELLNDSLETDQNENP